MLQWNTLIRSLGFTESETKIYLFSLEMGASSVQDLAKKAKVSRVTTYTAIESLTKHGLMSSVEKGKKTLYAAESPERLISFVHNRLKEMENTLREIQSSISELKLVQRGDRPTVKLFEGKEGLKAVHDDILKTNPDKILEINNIDAMLSLFCKDDFIVYQNELDKQKIISEIIAIYSQPVEPRTHANVLHLNGKSHRFYGNITIYNNKVALSSFQKKNISVLIESDIIAQTMRDLFRLAFEGAEKHKK